MFSARPSSTACSVGKRRDPLNRTPDSPTTNVPTPPAAASRRRLAHAIVAVGVVVWSFAAMPAASLAAWQPAAPAHAAAAAEQPPAAAEQPAAQGAQAPGEHKPAAEAAAEHGAAEGEGEQAESPWAAVARLFNFALLAGGLYYLLRSPLMGYLTQRGIQVRSELTKAAALRKEASAQLAQVEAKLAGLPGELEALKRRGAEEIATEEARISSLAEAERLRLLEQAKREIGNQLRLAERELKRRAGELAVDVATARAKRTITSADQQRLVDRYVEQVRH
jgi:F-type H+-transporting ATPase subunit b